MKEHGRNDHLSNQHCDNITISGYARQQLL